MNILDNLLSSDGYTPVNKALAKNMGFIVAGYFGELIRQRKRFGEEEFFFSQKQMEEEIGISGYEQRKCVKKLKEIGFITVEKKGLPAKYFFKINDELVLNFLNQQCFKKLRTSDLENKEHNNNIYNKNKNNNIIINNNKEQSSEIIKSNTYIDNGIEKYGNKEINNLQDFIKSKVTDLGFIYKKGRYERSRIKNLLESKDIKEILNKYDMGLYDFVSSIIYLSSKLSFWNGKIYNAETLYKHYAQIFNESLKIKKEKETKSKITVI